MNPIARALVFTLSLLCSQLALSMDRAELVEAIARDAGVTPEQAAAALDATLDNIQQALARGEQVYLADFGIFSSRQVSQGASRDPQTGEVVQRGFSVPTFKPEKSLRDALN